MSLRHYVVHTEPCAEPIAQANIIALGFSVYMPGIIRKHPQNFRDGASSRIEWLFPSYLFVEFDRETGAWRAITRAHGVRRVLGANPERPAPVPLGTVESLIEKFDAGGFNPPPEPGPIQAGEIVRVMTGSFADKVGMCMRSSNGRVRLLLSLFGGAVSVDFPSRSVERAAAGAYA